MTPWRGIIAALGLFSFLGGCASDPACHGSKPLFRSGCVPKCKRDHSCEALDAKLMTARRPLLDCIANNGKHSRVDAAHRCFRALRLLESTRWWLQTLTAESGFIPQVYRVPTETIRNQFLCAVEAMTRARSAAAVERIYLDIVRYYP